MKGWFIIILAFWLGCFMFGFGSGFGRLLAALIFGVKA